MALIEDVDVVASNSSADILCCVDDTIDLDLGSLRNHTRICCDGVPLLRQMTGTGHAASAFGALVAQAVSCQLELTQVSSASMFRRLSRTGTVAFSAFLFLL